MNKVHSHTRTTELNAAAIRIIELYSKNTVSNDEFLKSLIDSLKSQSDRMTIAIRRSRALSDLDDKDIARDEQIRALKALLQGYCKFPVDATREAAERVSVVFKKYGLSMVRANYAEETALIESLLKDFGEAGLANDIASLAGVADIVNRLSVAQRSFVSTRVEYEKELSAEAGVEIATDIKREIFDSINNKIVAYLTAMQLVDAEKYTAFAAAVDEIISTNNETVQRRKNLKKQEGESPQEAPPSTDAPADAEKK